MAQSEFEQFYAHIDAAPKPKPQERPDLRQIKFSIVEVLPSVVVFNPKGVKRLTVNGRFKKRG